MNDIKKIVRKSGTSFFWSMRFLPKAKREAMYTLYAFCRHIDDIVDGDSSIAETGTFAGLARRAGQHL